MDRSVRKTWTLSLGLGASLVTLASLPPFLGESGRHLIMEAFSGVCHQLPDRSPHINEVSLAVCHRCYATYWGLPGAALLFGLFRGAWPFTIRSAPWFLGAAIVPAVIDWGGDVLGFWSNTPISRMLTGGLMGLAACYFLVAAIHDMFRQRQRRMSVQKTRQHND